MRWMLLVVFLAGVAAGNQIGFERGFEVGIEEERIMSSERCDCYCTSDCCDEHTRISR